MDSLALTPVSAKIAMTLLITAVVVAAAYRQAPSS